MWDFQVVPKCSGVERRHSECESPSSLSVVDGDGEDRDGRAGHGVGAHQCTDVGQYPLL